MVQAISNSLARWKPMRKKSKLKANVKPSIGKAKLKGKAKPKGNAYVQGKADGQDQALPQQPVSSSGAGSRSGN